MRGRCFLAAGLAAIICGIQIGERDFVRIGLLAMLVPALAWLLLRRTERNVWVRRNVSATSRSRPGRPPRSRWRSATPVAGPAPCCWRRSSRLRSVRRPASWSTPSLPARSPRAATGCSTESRGRYPVGPMHVRVGDPLGMVDLDQVIPSTATVLVTPRTEPLPAIALTGRWAGAGDNRTRDLLGGGSPDVTIREYRLGDDLRRIHWPTTARVGELMVRREEQQWQSRCTVLIDNRRISHRGYGAKSSMERAVSVTASIMRYLVAQDFEVRLVSATGRSSSHGWHQGTRAVNLPEQLERLALMSMTRHESLSTGGSRTPTTAACCSRSSATSTMPTRTFWPAWRPRATRRTPWCWTSPLGPRRPRRSPAHRSAAQWRVEGHHPGARRLPRDRLDGAGAMSVEAARPPGLRRPSPRLVRRCRSHATRGDRVRRCSRCCPAGWRCFAWSGMVREPLDLPAADRDASER